MVNNIITIDFKDEIVPSNAVLKDSSINIILDGAETKLVLKVPFDSAVNLSESILKANGDKSVEEWENENLVLQTKVEELEEQLEIKDEVIENLRR